MNKITKLIIGLTALTSIVTPNFVMTSCSKLPDKPTEDVKFNLVSATMTTAFNATIVLDWTPTTNSLEFSNWRFVYSGSNKLLTFYL